jgi:NADH-quinone oxidoreductase subunit G
MPKLRIDGFEVEVPKGTKVITAAEKLGIKIPRFCYHPALGSVGACRVCAVKFLEGPIKGVQMSCMVDAADGMVVSTLDEEAVDFRKQVLEWLMMNHPHDCPVCDEGGECLLQDMTVSAGHKVRRYLGKKRTYRDQYLGPFIQHEMNRCIHCWRCRRFYQEFAGYRDLGAMQIAYRTYFGRRRDGVLESPFSGNLADICPTGVYTDKPSRFKGRRWEFERTPSVCIHCSLGCRIITNARYREVIRVESGMSGSVNGYFICDRGRYGFDYVNDPGRPRTAKAGGEVIEPDGAVQKAAERLTRISKDSGPQAIACLGSMRNSLETQAILRELCELNGWQTPDYFMDRSEGLKLRRAVSRLDPSLAVSMMDIQEADFVLSVGADPVNEAPMLVLAMRQAYRNGAAMVVIDPRPVSLPFSFEHIPAPPWDTAKILRMLLDGSSSPNTLLEKTGDWPGLSSIAERLEQSQNPVVICGVPATDESIVEAAADLASRLRDSKKRAGLFYVMPGPNAFGATLLSGATGGLEGTIEKIENGSVKALLVVENDPFWSFPDETRLEGALRRLDLLVVIDYLPTPTAQRAEFFIPSSTAFETASTFINQEGRIQATRPAYQGGIPIDQLTAGEHPPRAFKRGIPRVVKKPAWQILSELFTLMARHGKSVPSEMSREIIWRRLTQANPTFANLPFPETDTDTKTFRVNLGQSDRSEAREDIKRTQEGRSVEGRLLLQLINLTFGTEELASYSSPAHQAEKEPCLFMHRDDAAKSDLRDGERVRLQLPGGPVDLSLCVKEHMAPGLLFLPKHRQLSWRKLREAPFWIEPSSLTKA